MNELIPITMAVVNHETIQTVNARDLHAFVKSKQRFADWIKNRLEGYTQDIDFTVHKSMTQYNQVDTVEYYLTLDMGKELGMLERNDKGREIRQYFIECERIALQSAPPRQLSRLEIAEQLVESLKREEQLLLENKQQQDKIEEDAPKVQAYDAFMNSDGLITIRDAARYFNVQEEAFKTFLRLIHFIEKCSTKHAPMAETRRSGYMRYFPCAKQGHKGSLGTSYITPLGMDHLTLRKERFRTNNPDMYNKVFDGKEF